MKINTIKAINCFEWDKLVQETYGRTYSFQQQDGCKSRGTENITIPIENYEDPYDNDTVEEKVNSEEMGVSFKAWLERDPKQKLSNKEDQNTWSLDMWYDRSFYPDVQMVANDLHKKGLIEAGDYTIIIDW